MKSWRGSLLGAFLLLFAALVAAGLQDWALREADKDTDLLGLEDLLTECVERGDCVVIHETLIGVETVDPKR